MNERMILLTLMALKSVVFYLLLVALFLYFFPGFISGNAAAKMSMELLPDFRAQALLAVYYIVSVFLFLFLLFCRFAYPVALRAYEGAIVSSKSLMRIHMILIARPANLFLGGSYVYRGSAS